MGLLQISYIWLWRKERILYILVSCSGHPGSSFLILGISQGYMGERKDKSKVDRNTIQLLKLEKNLRDFLLKLFCFTGEKCGHSKNKACLGIYGL